MDLVSRLKHFLDLQQISVTQFADVCGIPRPTASQLLAGRNKKVSDEIISKIHQCYPDLSIMWLMFGEGEIYAAKSRSSIPSSPQSTPATSTIDEEFEFTTSNMVEIENSPDLMTGSEFVFANDGDSQNKTSNDSQMQSQPTNQTFSFAKSNTAHEEISEESDQPDPKNQGAFASATSSGKRVTGIVVYYDDQTYESFIPDPDHLHPFMRK